jgi:hypothetical protein
MDDNLYIQRLENSGWTTIRCIGEGMLTLNGSDITRAMQELARVSGGKRVRAVDGNDRLVDML